MKPCKECNKNIALTGRRICIYCHNKKELEKAKEYKRREREKAKIKKEKVIERKKVLKDRKQNSVSYLTKQADKLWSEAVKINYNYSCQYCGKTENLNSHHLFTRSRKSTRWNIENGICLCAGHHTLSSEFSAHQTGNEFFIWLEEIKGREFIDTMNKKSHEVIKVTPDYVKSCIEEIKKFIQENT